MYTIGVKKRFSAAHSLREYDGNCERLHGHNFVVEVICSGKDVDRLGMLLDFRVLKKELKELLDELDHHFLNDLEPFKNKNPSSENIARYVYDRLAGRLKTPPEIKEVRVWESEDSWAAYSRD